MGIRTTFRKKRCTHCNRDISVNTYNKHRKACLKTSNGLKAKKSCIDVNECKKIGDKYECPKCEKLYSKKGLGTHYWRKHAGGVNWDGNVREYKNGTKTVWNKGRTKETCSIVKQQAENLSKKYLSGELKHVYSFTDPNFWTSKRRKEQSIRKKTLYKKHPEKHPNRKLANNRTFMSYPERVAYDYLINNNIEFQHQEKIDDYYVDFLIESTIIEIDGEYWHPKGNSKDIKRDTRLKSLGYKVHRIRSKERIENRLKKILQII